MELRKHLDLRVILVAVYLLLFGAYIYIGLRPASAAGSEVSADLSIPSIGLDTGVVTLHIRNSTLEAPDELAGSLTWAQNKILLIGHSRTVFENLDKIAVGDKISYDYLTYEVKNIEVKNKEEIKMEQILKGESQETLVLMTCAGESLGDDDATERLIVTAVRDSVKTELVFN